MNNLEIIKQNFKNKINEGLTTNSEFKTYIYSISKKLNKKDIEYLLSESYICECDGKEHSIIKETLIEILNKKST